jgi:pimeloyl-ACP methyl ester carboxylesterase
VFGSELAYTPTAHPQRVVHPCRIGIAAGAIDELRRRLRAARLPPLEPTDAGAGTPGELLQGLCAHWASTFDWDAAQERLNGVEQVEIELGGARIHAWHVPGRGPRPLPLVLTHGWPSSGLEYLDVIERLADPALDGGDRYDAFSVVVPSLPGFGFSGAPRGGPATVAAIAELWVELMSALGYERFAAHGGDLGAGVTARLALQHPDRLAGIHLTHLADVGHEDHIGDTVPDDPEFALAASAWRAREGAYAALQSTKPDTVGVALTDSPVALASWLLEKVWNWTEPAAGGGLPIDFDRLCRWLTVYWVSRCAAPSLRLYRENAQQLAPMRRDQRIRVPTAVSLYRNERVPEPHPSRAWAESVYAISRWRELPAGGHFPALEQPDLFVEDVRAALRPLR